jgi:hypothetical protein
LGIFKAWGWLSLHCSYAMPGLLQMLKGFENIFDFGLILLKVFDFIKIKTIGDSTQCTGLLLGNFVVQNGISTQLFW